MKILAIETSCDETAVAVLDISGPLETPEITVLGNALYSQAKLHAEYGGVYPNLAKREHQKNLPVLLEKVLKESGINDKESEIDLIAVTAGPGLEPALWTGITFAEELGEKWKKPVLPINHMEGHIWSVLYRKPAGSTSDEFLISNKLELPALALLVSGGHTELVYIQDFGKYEILGRTKDDAVGEAFDKVARMLGLPYPGGPEVSKLAREERAEGKPALIQFPRPMLRSGTLDFSYSGLKTAILYHLKKYPEITKDVQREVARAFEDAAVEVLVEKTRQALQDKQPKTLIVAGGVAANTYLRQEMERILEDTSDAELLFPTRELSTDNAVMIGIAGYVRASTHPLSDNQDSKEPGQIRAQGNLSLS